MQSSKASRLAVARYSFFAQKGSKQIPVNGLVAGQKALVQKNVGKLFVDIVPMGKNNIMLKHAGRALSQVKITPSCITQDVRLW